MDTKKKDRNIIAEFTIKTPEGVKNQFLFPLSHS